MSALRLVEIASKEEKGFAVAAVGLLRGTVLSSLSRDCIVPA